MDAGVKSWSWLAIPLLAALIAAGAFLELDLGPVPLTLQSYFVLLAGFVLGPWRGALAATLYLLAGLVGLPVFAGGTSGWQRLLGPTGGFLWSFPLAAGVAGWATKDRTPLTFRRGFLWGALASVIPFVIGVPWLESKVELGPDGMDLWPFLPGAAIKLVLAVATCLFLEKWKGHVLPPV